jgi:hypothetical protein
MKSRREKQIFSRGGREWAQGRGSECVYHGCILYPYMKIEE